MKFSIKILTIVFQFTLIFLLCSCDNNVNASNNENTAVELKSGNSSANLLSYGIATNKFGRSYYIGFNDNYESVLRSINSDGSDSNIYTFSASEKISYLNKINSYFYYVDELYGEEDSESSTFSIWELNPDDNVRTMLYSTNDCICFLNVVDNTMYFTTSYNIYSMDLMGNNLKTIVSSDSILYSMYIYDDNIYYDDNNKIYKTDLNGNLVTELFEFSDKLLWCYCIYNSKIYYFAYNGDQASIYSMDLNGENDEKLCDIQGRKMPHFMNYYDDMLIFDLTLYDSDDNILSTDICTINLDGTNLNTLTTEENTTVYGLNVIDDNVIYMNPDTYKIEILKLK